MTIQKISGFGLSQAETAHKSNQTQQHLALPQELPHDSVKLSKTSFKGQACGTGAAATAAAACIATGVGSWT